MPEALIMETQAARPDPNLSAQLPRIEPGEWRAVAWVVVAVVAVTSLPYIYAYASAPAGRQFMGILLNVPDHAQYFSWLRQYYTSNLARNLLTAEPNPPVFFNLLWWLLARLGAALGWDFAVLFQVLRVGAAAVTLPAIYHVIAWFLADRLQRALAFGLAVFAAGLGWTLVLAKYALHLPEVPAPLLLYVSEPNTFYSILATPHLTNALLYVAVFDLVLRAEARQQWRWVVLAGLLTQALGWAHAYDLWLVYGVLGAYGLLKWARDRRPPGFLLRAGLVLAALSAWPALYAVWLTSRDPLWREVLRQFANAGVFTPNLLQLPVLLGLGFLAALAAELRSQPLRLAGRRDLELFLRAWFWMNFLLIYLPTDYQIKMLNGWQIPIGILAARGLLGGLWPWLRARAARRSAGPPVTRWAGVGRPALAALLLAAVLPANLYLYAWRFYDLGRHAPPYYLGQSELAALDWLARNTPADSVVLSSLTIGEYLPALTGRPAFLAHWAQTVDYYAKADQVAEFFDAAISDDRRQAILLRAGVDYVFYGPEERALGRYQPAGAAFLRPVYSSPQVTVYQLR